MTEISIVNGMNEYGYQGMDLEIPKFTFHASGNFRERRKKENLFFGRYVDYLSRLYKLADEVEDSRENFAEIIELYRGIKNVCDDCALMVVTNNLEEVDELKEKYDLKFLGIDIGDYFEGSLFFDESYDFLNEYKLISKEEDAKAYLLKHPYSGGYKNQMYYVFRYLNDKDKYFEWLEAQRENVLSNQDMNHDEKVCRLALIQLYLSEEDYWEAYDVIDANATGNDFYANLLGAYWEAHFLFDRPEKMFTRLREQITQYDLKKQAQIKYVEAWYKRKRKEKFIEELRQAVALYDNISGPAIVLIKEDASLKNKKELLERIRNNAVIKPYEDEDCIEPERYLDEFICHNIYNSEEELDNLLAELDRLELVDRSELEGKNPLGTLENPSLMSVLIVLAFIALYIYLVAYVF